MWNLTFHSQSLIESANICTYTNARVQSESISKLAISKTARGMKKVSQNCKDERYQIIGFLFPKIVKTANFSKKGFWEQSL